MKKQAKIVDFFRNKQLKRKLIKGDENLERVFSLRVRVVDKIRMLVEI